MNNNTKIFGAALIGVAVLVVGFFLFRGGGDDSGEVNNQALSTSGIEDVESLENVTVSCLFGSEKKGYLADPQVVNILKNRYKITLDCKSEGSVDMVTRTDTQLGGADFLWPSSRASWVLFEATHPNLARSAKEETIFGSPLVLCSTQSVLDGLTELDLVEQKTDGTYHLDVHTFLRDYEHPQELWANTPAAGAANGFVQIESTDPTRSNSGFVMMMLRLAMLSSDSAFVAPTIDQVRPFAEELASTGVSQPTYLRSLQGESTGDAFEAWIPRKGLPLLACYENQAIEFLLDPANPETGTGTFSKSRFRDEFRMIYPDPTLDNEHVGIALTDNGERLLAALQDDELQRIAWEEFGFRGNFVDEDAMRQRLGHSDATPLNFLSREVEFTRVPSAEVIDFTINCLERRC